MIDIHVHILPEMDDGSQSLEESLDMLRIAVESGVNAMVATPHCNIPGVYDNYYDVAYLNSFRRLTERIQEEQIPITLIPGMEVFMTSDIPDLLKQKKLITINQGPYLLVEFAFDLPGEYMTSMLQPLKQQGVIPVIAHPERYDAIQREMRILQKWQDCGYAIQINKGSLEGDLGAREQDAAFWALEKGLCSVVASDAHSPIERNPWMKDIYEDLLEDFDEKYLEILFCENPWRICNGEKLLTTISQER